MNTPLSRLFWETEWLACTACKDIVPYRSQVVPGHGNPKSGLVFFGEAPGENEDQCGIPFVGKAGNLLRGYIWKLAALEEDEFFLDNVVMCRPTRQTGEELRNREPTAQEVHNCRERLLGTVYELDPLLIVALGGTALRALTGETKAISKARGEMFHITVPGVMTDVTYPVLATYHPSFLVRQRSQAKVTNSCWATMRDDLILAVNIYDQLRAQYHGIEPPNRRALMEQRQEHADE